MGHRVYHRLGPAVVCGLLSLSVLQGVLVSRAGATCGDWLAQPGGAQQISANEAMASHAQSTDQSASHQNSRAPRLPVTKQCNGPYCRSAPFQSAPSAPTSISSSSERLAVFGRAELQLACSTRFGQSGEPDACPTPGFKARIEHPPRA
jgi:hypothetical protein